MNDIKTLTKKNDKLYFQIRHLNKPIAGNLCKSEIPKGSGNFFFRLTWKEKQKTKIMYIRNDEVKPIKKGIKEFAKLKKIINTIGSLNRKLIRLKRKH